MALVGPAIEDVEISRTVELLGGRRILLSTPAGVESVEDHLTRLEYGVYT